MSARSAAFVIGVSALACTPQDRSSLDQSTSNSNSDTGSETDTETDSETDIETDTDGDGDTETGGTEPLPTECEPSAEPSCVWTEIDELVVWETEPSPPPPLPSGESRPCHSNSFQLVIDGDSIVVAFAQDYCTDEVGPEGERLGPYTKLVIGTDTAGVWQTEVFGDGNLDRDSPNLEIGPDGTVRVATTAFVYERSAGEWSRRDPAAPGRPSIMSDPQTEVLHSLFYDSTLRYGTTDGDLTQTEAGLVCDASVVLGFSDFEVSPLGEPHIALLENHKTGVPGATEVTLSISRRTDGVWLRESTECMVQIGGNAYDRPDLEFDGDGNVHLCTKLNVDGAQGYQLFYFTNASGAWTSEIVGEAPLWSPCQLEVDDLDRVHLLERRRYLVGEAGSWTTAASFEEDQYTALRVTPDGSATMLGEGLELLTNASGEWVERKLGFVP